MTDARTEELIAVLTRIAVALEAPAVPLQPDPEPRCTHPERARVSFSSMGTGDEWECVVTRGGCGFRSSSALMPAGAF